MNVLDENIPDPQRQWLRSWGIPVRQIGQDVSQKGLPDDAIVPLLHQLPRPTFFTLDDGFYRRVLCHARYCIVCLVVSEDETASFIRRFLRHRAFSTHTRRRGTVVRVAYTSVRFWRISQADEGEIRWLE